MKSGSRVVCDCERRWREGGGGVKEDAREVMSWRVAPEGMRAESLRPW